MLNAHSPLGENASVTFDGLVLSEKRGFTLIQLAGNKAHFKKDLGLLPEFGQAAEKDGRLFMRLAENQIWVIGEVIDAKLCHATQLSSSRTCIEITGEKARQLLATSSAIDFAPAQFPAGNFVLTGIHHTPVLIHCVAENTFHIFAMRTFALSVWDWLRDAAEGLN